MKVIELPPYDAVNNRSSNIYKEHAVLRKRSGDFNLWFKKQYARQGAECYYCRDKLKNKRVNVEHIKPKSKGGDNSSNNMVLSCAACNKEKGSKLLTSEKLKRFKKRNNKRRRKSAMRYKHDMDYQSTLAEQINIHI